MVLASRNVGKLREIAAILQGTDIVLLPLPDGAPEPEETGETFAENAYLKAQSAMVYTGKPAIADDSGLVVDALDGAPGVRSKRYCDGSDLDRNHFLLKNLQEIPDERRTARFICAVSAVFPDGGRIETLGTCEGVILREMRGQNGFGYDPLFYVPQEKGTFGELPDEVKNRISHRAAALRKWKQVYQVSGALPAKG